ncbi:MAG: hypothetical protein PHT19_17615 [Methylococcus sp.]|nr:hypothetical protein [Methylococcus sp.]
MTALALASIVCGFGQIPTLDAYGNETCRDVQTGQIRHIEGGLSDCPMGTTPRLTNRGPACVQKDTGQPYFDERRECPLGTVPRLDEKGNRVCGGS